MLILILAVEKSSGKENSSLPLSALWPVMDLRKTDLFGRESLTTEYGGRSPLVCNFD